MTTMYVALLIAVAVVTLEARHDTAEDNMVKALRFYESLKRDVQLDDQLPNDDSGVLEKRRSKISRIYLKGATGREEITLGTDQSGEGQRHTLSTNWKGFDLMAGYKVYIGFMTYDGEVFVKDPERYNIEYEDEPEDWRCGMSSTDWRCGAVKQGQLYWDGHYILTKK